MGSHLPDEVLACRASAGDLKDFEELLRRHRKRVYSICFRMAGNAEDAEDWAQDCFVRIYAQLGRYNPALPFSPWMLRVVSNTCVNLAKSRQSQLSRLGPSLEDHHEVAGTAPDPMQTTLRSDEARRIETAVADLTPQLRQAVALRVVEGLSFHEISDTLGVPLQTAASRVRRALMQIRERLSPLESEVER